MRFRIGMRLARSQSGGLASMAQKHPILSRKMRSFLDQ
jgi:hypothetical protein